MVALLTSVRNSPCFGGLRRTKTCHRQLFARPSVFLRYFLHAAKSNNPYSLAGSFEVSQTSNQRTQNNDFAQAHLNSFAASRQCPCRDSTLRVHFAPPLAASFFVAAATNLCASRYYRRLCRLCNFPMESSSLRDARSACISRRPRRH